ncbi:hypothetical protein BU23DRAFT_534554 [Bimuria novae-zelandiae CBS 107.79]|uniref:DUF6536 domain-containing protein n=1 Tax=Bimuria novae-zelandiae CBS 107.79 TaxID=1447943 RepID=A0A6A5V6M8_9PLEO|nr:hypothetical protein BU23DRAFT_534554 [Bimuria novae-zelandiae CBS 107.79]
MFGFRNTYTSSKNWAQQLRTQTIRKQQWNDADETELRKLARSTTGHPPDTSYHPHAMRLEETEFADVNGKVEVQESRAKKYTSGWRYGAINCAVSASVVFLINFIITIVFSARQNGVLFDGDCDYASKLNTGLHLIINLLSTVLLSSSNYCMQCLSAPTRKEVDEAHAKGKWLDIGVQSLHNLWNSHGPEHIRRSVVWLLLGLSSLPLHLFYNSAIFLTISSNDYYAFNVRESFIKNASCGDCGAQFGNPYDFGHDYESDVAKTVRTMHEKARNRTLDRLSNSECIREYAESIQSKRRNVLLVAADNKMPSPNVTANGTTSDIYAYNSFEATTASNKDEAMNAYSWICSSNPTWKYTYCSNLVNGIQNAPEQWTVGYKLDFNITGSDPYTGYRTSPTYPVDYCLSEKAEPRCKIQFTLPIAILVTILNVFKAILIFYTAFGTKEEPLMTMGDAVASFLERQDETTKGMCLLSVRDVKSHKGYFPVGVKAWSGKRRRFKDVTSRTRRAVTFAMLFITLIAIAGLLIFGVSELPSGTSRSVAGYGAIDTRTIMSYYTEFTTIQYVLLANIAQPILSFLYFSYNGLFTAMLLGYEWVSYAHQRKGLRVSRTPEGAQRSTYFLQLPYRFALPLMGLGGALHWLVSQSIFLVAIDVYAFDGSQDGALGDDWKSTGYSPIAIFTTIMLGTAMTLAAIGFGWVPFKEGMNLAGSCSAAISAACHEVDAVDGYEAARSKVQWGVVGENADNVGHCTFSTREVEMPKVGQVYAGISGSAGSVARFGKDASL